MLSALGLAYSKIKLQNSNTEFFLESERTYVYFCLHTHTCTPTLEKLFSCSFLQEESWPLQLLKLANVIGFLISFCPSSAQASHLHYADPFLPCLFKRNLYSDDAVCVYSVFDDLSFFQGSTFLSSPMEQFYK